MKNKIKQYKIIITILTCTGIVVFFSSGLQTEQPVEDKNVINAIGQDIELEGNILKYIAPYSVYLFEPENKIESVSRIGTGSNSVETRQSRQLTDDKQGVLGLEKIYIISEATARYGIREHVNSQFRSSNSNDNAYTMICKGKASDMLSMKIKGYPSSADYIEGLIKNSIYYNFFSNEYKKRDLYIGIDSEGHNIVLPYIENTVKGISITGMALFNKDKMVAKINVDELKIMNMMRGNDVKGILSIQKAPRKFISYYATSKRRISCTKEGKKYKFTINIDLKGDILVDTLYKGLQKDPKKVIEFNKEMSEKVKKECNDFILKMKNEYKVDCLQLGQIAVAKYGRYTGVDWNSIVCNSEIEVNVKVKVQKTGRGDY